MTEPECIEHQLALFEALRRLGFTADEIYVAFYGDTLFTELWTHGSVFRIEVAKGIPDQQAYGVAWTDACNRWNGEMTESERQRIYRSLPAGYVGQLTAALVTKGFKLRARP